MCIMMAYGMLLDGVECGQPGLVYVSPNNEYVWKTIHTSPCCPPPLPALMTLAGMLEHTTGQVLHLQVARCSPPRCPRSPASSRYQEGRAPNRFGGFTLRSSTPFFRLKVSGLVCILYECRVPRPPTEQQQARARSRAWRNGLTASDEGMLHTAVRGTLLSSSCQQQPLAVPGHCLLSAARSVSSSTEWARLYLGFDSFALRLRSGNRAA